jgi:uncharacterized membrane-anchored protein
MADEPAAAPAEPLTPAQQEVRAAWSAAAAAMIHGPSVVALRDQGQIALPAGYGFVPTKESAAVMHLMGNTTDAAFVGLIFPEDQEKSWIVSIDFEDAGYIKDDDARDWNADELLQSLKDGTEASNEERTKLGIPPIKVTRWIERPQYESGKHQLVWSAEAKLKDGEDPDPTVNYNTYVLGREGYISLNLITSASTVDADKPAARELLSAVNFKEGKRYADFNSSTDKVAAYGLAALVAGVAAKKLGLLALAGAFILKFAKVFALGAAVAGGGVWKWLKGRSGKDPGTPA